MKPTIALFIHHPKCSIQSGNGIIGALDSYYKFKIFTHHRVEKDFFDDVDIVAIPGGLGDAASYTQLLDKNHSKIIRNFINDGGRYLGICMGAYWAGQHYLNILKNVDVVQYITRPKTDTRRPHAKHLSVVWNNKETHMFFYDGCAFVGSQNNFQTIATYANGDPMAIYQNRIGLIGCHPEATEHWYDSYAWLRKYWPCDQRPALLDFVNQLIKN